MYESFRQMIYILTVCESSEKLHLFVHPWVFFDRKWWMNRAEFLCHLIRLFLPLFSESSTMFLFAPLSRRLSRKVKYSRLTAPTPSVAQRSLNLVQSSLAERWSWRNHLSLLSCDAELISYKGCIVWFLSILWLPLAICAAENASRWAILNWSVFFIFCVVPLITLCSCWAAGWF